MQGRAYSRPQRVNLCVVARPKIIPIMIMCYVDVLRFRGSMCRVLAPVFASIVHVFNVEFLSLTSPAVRALPKSLFRSRRRFPRMAAECVVADRCEGPARSPYPLPAPVQRGWCDARGEGWRV